MNDLYKHIISDFQWIKIERGTVKRIKEQFKIEQIHPESPLYKQYWRNLREKLVNGVWIEQFGKLRYMPGRLIFYGIFGRIEVWNEDGTRLKGGIAPDIRDLDWHRAYNTLISDGFSGFSDDPYYTCDEAVIVGNIENIKSKVRYESLFTKEGKLKTYVPPLEYIMMLRDEDYGHPLYYNNAWNLIEFGSRGGGKSYYTAIAEVVYDLCFDGQKFYKPGMKPKTTASIEVTSSGGGKSTELLEKAKYSIDALATDHTLGVWSTPDKTDYEPCPFWKHMTGSIAANNKENPWINADMIKKGNKWSKTIIGTGSVVYNTVYSSNQIAGGLKSAGGRRTRVIHEEAGLNTYLLQAIDSNEGLVSEAGATKMASQKVIGTSGDIVAVLPAKTVFTNPLERRFFPFKYEGKEEVYGFFLPAYMADPSFKDEDGNTDIESAFKHYDKIQRQKAKASDPQVLSNHRMNFPIVIEDMWIDGSYSILPSKEAEEVERNLLKDNLYMKLGTPVELFFGHQYENGVGYKIKHDANPFYDFPISPKREDFEGCIMIYIFPDKLKIGGSIPPDMCIITHDPYVSDNAGESLGATHVWVNPKYIPAGKPGNCLAATYFARPAGGYDIYLENLEKLIAFYGNPVRGLWYEADRGDRLRGYFLLKKKLDLLCLRPKFEQGDYIFDKVSRQTGFITGSREGKLNLIQRFRDWLLRETELEENGELVAKLNIERIPCIFTIRQIKMFKMKGNFDAISSAYAFPLALSEYEHYLLDNNKNKKHIAPSLISNFLSRKKNKAKYIKRLPL